MRSSRCIFRGGRATRPSGTSSNACLRFRRRMRKRSARFSRRPVEDRRRRSSSRGSSTRGAAAAWGGRARAASRATRSGGRPPRASWTLSACSATSAGKKASLLAAQRARGRYIPSAWAPPGARRPPCAASAATPMQRPSTASRPPTPGGPPRRLSSTRSTPSATGFTRTRFLLSTGARSCASSSSTPACGPSITAIRSTFSKTAMKRRF
mmetsp:Transcript_44150/g.100541  ORF Transcript_44150/g.100541 Transcript_44150/m.100541 type:complete len:210 (+) Transcript_44150:339-968(+)